MKKIIMILCVLSFSLFFINPMEKLTYAVEDNQIYQKQELTVEQAKELLLKHNHKVDYTYQGNSNDFEYLKSKYIK